MGDSLQDFVQNIAKAERARSCAKLTDGELLKQFVASKDDRALELLAMRHATMVWCVCRRILPNEQDAEDAFQATFLVLLNKAAGIRPAEMVGNWLHGVARRTALKAKAALGARTRHERKVARSSGQSDSSNREQLELRQFLDRELSHLSAKYRIPILLCDLEGLSRHDACLRLGWPDGTLSGRLARGRALLARRLLRRGFGALASAQVASALGSEVKASAPLNLLQPVFAYGRGPWSTASGTAKLSFSTIHLARKVGSSMSLMMMSRMTAISLMVAMIVGASGFALQQAGSRSPGTEANADEQKSRNQKEQAAPAKTEEACIKEMQAAAQKALEVRFSEFLAGRGTVELLYNHSERSLQADLEVAKSRQERIAVSQAHLDRMAEMEKIIKVRYEAGQMDTGTFEDSKYFRSKAELNLLREKKRQ